MLVLVMFGLEGLRS